MGDRTLAASNEVNSTGAINWQGRQSESSERTQLFWSDSHSASTVVPRPNLLNICHQFKCSGFVIDQRDWSFRLAWSAITVQVARIWSPRYWDELTRTQN